MLLVTRLGRAGWEELVGSMRTYVFGATSGANVVGRINESFVAQISDSFSETPFGQDVLNGVRRYRVVAKLGEWARDPTDPQSFLVADAYVDDGVDFPVFADVLVPGAQDKVEYAIEERIERQVLYLTLFVLAPPTEDMPDWRWAYGDSTTFTRTFAYGRYGHGAAMFTRLPLAWQALDGGT